MATSLHLRIRIHVRGPNGERFAVEAVHGRHGEDRNRAAAASEDRAEASEGRA